MVILARLKLAISLGFYDIIISCSSPDSTATCAQSCYFSFQPINVLLYLYWLSRYAHPVPWPQWHLHMDNFQMFNSIPGAHTYLQALIANNLADFQPLVCGMYIKFEMSQTNLNCCSPLKPKSFLFSAVTHFSKCHCHSSSCWCQNSWNHSSSLSIMIHPIPEQILNILSF